LLPLAAACCRLLPLAAACCRCLLVCFFFLFCLLAADSATASCSYFNRILFKLQLLQFAFQNQESFQMSKAPNAIPRALTAEANGEISCSIEETNRVRALLGLKPLKMGSDRSGGVKEIDATAEARRKEAEDAQEALRLKIEASKKLRAVKCTVMSSSTLAEEADDDEDVNVWIEKQKKATQDKQARDKELALRRARELEEAEAAQSAYSAKDLSGMKVKHGAGDIKAGESMILTLKDSRIVTKGDDGFRVLNEEEDELENIVLAADERKRISEARLKKATKYSHLDNEANGHKSGEASLLPQYDEIEEKEGIR
jgi:U4/U6.U5 tri-snRNP-associated protein 1